jgi:hypothetical protein
MYDVSGLSHEDHGITIFCHDLILVTRDIQIMKPKVAVLKHSFGINGSTPVLLIHKLNLKVVRQSFVGVRAQELPTRVLGPSLNYLVNATSQ